jgi:hypothetical protein
MSSMLVNLLGRLRLESSAVDGARTLQPRWLWLLCVRQGWGWEQRVV